MSTFLLLAAVLLGVHALRTLCVLLFAYLPATPRYPDCSVLPSATVLIPTFNERGRVEQAIASLLRNLPERVDVLVVDDGSTDGTPDVVIAAFAGDKRVRVLCGEHKGYGATLQRGLENCLGEILVIADADSEYSSEYVLCGLRAFADPTVWAARALLCVNNPSTPLLRMQDDDFVGTSADMRAFSQAGMLTVVSGAAGFWRVAALKANGGFRAEMLSADFDATIRLLSAGGLLRLLPHCRVSTDLSATIPACFRQRRRWIYGGNQVFVRAFGSRQSLQSACVLWFTFLFRQCLHGLAPLMDAAALLALFSSAAFIRWYAAAYGCWIVLDAVLLVRERSVQGARQTIGAIVLTPLRRAVFRIVLCLAFWSAFWHHCRRKRVPW